MKWLGLAWLICASVFATCPTRDLSIPSDILAMRTQGNRQFMYQLHKLSSNADLPVNVRRVLHEALVKRDTDVRKLTSAIRKAYQLDGDWAGFHAAALPETKHDGLIGFDPAYLNNPTKVFAQTNLLGKPKMEVLVHELAHVRLIAFLNKNFQKMCENGRFPKWAIEKKFGTYFMRKDVYTYLCERYAYEIEYQFAKTQSPTLLQSIFGREHDVYGDMKNPNDAEVTKKIIAHIRKKYPTTDKPEIRALDGLSVSQILLGRSQ